MGLRTKGYVEKNLETRGVALPTTDPDLHPDLHGTTCLPTRAVVASIKLEALQSHLEVSLNHTALGPVPRASLANLQDPENLHFKQAPE